MGTRGLVGFAIDGEEKLTYNHFDSYPSELGLKVLAFLHERAAGEDPWVERLREEARDLMLVSSNSTPTLEVQERAVELGLHDSDVSTGETREWYSLLRHAQGDLAAYLEFGFMEDGSAFATDSLFCEWGYVVDLDTQTFEIYRGFQKRPPPKGQRFHRRLKAADTHSVRTFTGETACYTCGAEAGAPERKRFCPGQKYREIHMVASFPLTSLPDEETFLAIEETIYASEA